MNQTRVQDLYNWIGKSLLALSLLHTEGVMVTPVILAVVGRAHPSDLTCSWHCLCSH